MTSHPYTEFQLVRPQNVTRTTQRYLIKAEKGTVVLRRERLY